MRAAEGAIRYGGLPAYGYLMRADAARVIELGLEAVRREQEQEHARQG